jgi:MFS family permease
LTFFIALLKAVQGLGGGAISSMTAIILADLVPLRERGIYNGLLGMYVLSLNFLRQILIAYFVRTPAMIVLSPSPAALVLL